MLQSRPRRRLTNGPHGSRFHSSGQVRRRHNAGSNRDYVLPRRSGAKRETARGSIAVLHSKTARDSAGRQESPAGADRLARVWHAHADTGAPAARRVGSGGDYVKSGQLRRKQRTPLWALVVALALGVSGSHLHAQAPAMWKPAPNTTWQWQLTGRLDMSVEADVFDVDLFDVTAAQVAELRSRGRRVICYLSAGSFERWRPDAGLFPDSIKGNTLDGWPDERWLDIRRLDVLGPLMEARLDLCKAKGFDAVEPDNIDAYVNRSGFPLTYSDQLRYNLFLAEAAHRRGLSIGLKNNLDQVRDLLPHYDWAMNEECFQYRECHKLQPFVEAGKAVFHVEYVGDPATFCAQANALNFNSLKKNLSLDAYRVPCRSSPGVALREVTHGASFLPAPLAPGAIVSIFGRNLGPAAAAALRLDSAGRVSSELEGVRVYYDGLAAPLLFVRADQVNAIVPFGVDGKTRVDVQLRYRDHLSDILSRPVAQTSPGVFTKAGNGSGPAALVNENGSVNSAENPAAAGSVIAVYVAGAGALTPRVPDGAVMTGELPKLIHPVTATIGGRDARVQYAGAAPGFVAGLMQVNVSVPEDMPDAASVPLVIRAAGVESQPGVTMSVGRR